MKNRNNYFKRTIGAIAGLMLFGLGVYLTVQTNMGVAPWDVLCFGIAGKTGIIYGNVSIMISVVLIIIDVLVLKEKIGIAQQIVFKVVRFEPKDYTNESIIETIEHFLKIKRHK